MRKLVLRAPSRNDVLTHRSVHYPREMSMSREQRQSLSLHGAHYSDRPSQIATTRGHR